ncbi:MAG: glutamate--tRNA ligase [bacterium]|nr:glutamate--tRNA ligase [bacterium]
MVRVRFAPSPTGYLHVGGLRTALYNWLLARREGGQFLLRIEDTDRTRLVEGAVEALLDSLKWAGITPDEGALVGGPYGPYVQSERLPIYREMVDKLIAAGHAYYCFCTPEELAARRAEKEAQGESTAYDRHCRSLSKEEVERRLGAGEPYVVRMIIPDGREIVIDDVVRGQVSFDSSLVDDQILLKSDGFPTYHLAAVVDDHLMKITHVIRGEEWLSSTPKHVLLYEYFGWEPPKFAHVPLIINESGKKLSKRDGDVSVEAYREKGYLPEGLLNFLAMLGWNPGDEREFFTKETLAECFSLERVRKSGAVFDFNKLLYINGLHMRTIPADKLADMVLPFFDKAGWERPERDYLIKVIEVMAERANLLTDYVEPIPYFYKDPTEYEEATVKKRWKAASHELLSGWADEMKNMEEFTPEALEASLRAYAESHGVGAGQLIHPTRLAITGVGNGPSLFHMMEVLGKDTCLRRIEAALKVLA